MKDTYLIGVHKNSLSNNHREIIRLKNSNEENKHEKIAMIDRESGILKREIERILKCDKQN